MRSFQQTGRRNDGQPVHISCLSSCADNRQSFIWRNWVNFTISVQGYQVTSTFTMDDSFINLARRRPLAWWNRRGRKLNSFPARSMHSRCLLDISPSRIKVPKKIANNWRHYRTQCCVANSRLPCRSPQTQFTRACHLTFSVNDMSVSRKLRSSLAIFR